MASRRSRIKGIANIPQRRKANTLEEDTVSEGSSDIQNKISEPTEPTSENVICRELREPNETELIIAKESNVTSHEDNRSFNCEENKNRDQIENAPQRNIQHTVVPDDEPTPESKCKQPSTDTYIQNKLSNDNIISNTINSEIIPEINGGKPDSKDLNKVITSKEKTFVAPPKSADTSCEINSNTQHNESNFENIKKIEDKNNVEGEKQVTNAKPVVKSGNRLHRFIKPRPTIISRQNKISTERQESCLNEVSGINKCDLNKADIGNSPDELYPAKENISVLPKEVEYTLCETQLTSECANLNNEDEKTEKSAKKLSLNIVSTSNSEVEYPLPPASPNKINRSRIKAIPKFDHRRTSFSASESEDESRKHRHRNDSISSSVSGVQEALTDCLMSPQRTKEFSSAFQKKCRRTEQSRKLAEARREFHMKFGKDTPNRSKLTMMDLIFYNPKTNPMQGNKIKTKTTSTSITEEDPTENPDDPAGIVDDPTTQDKDHSDGEIDMPAPQIKIGPSGELIIDEKSLVFESKKTKKDREELQQSAVINVDHDGAYGIYKKGKRNKDWDQMETIRFYKALNTIGTDFSLMCELFPNRSRRELKVKFNKEERINRGLVDRAITQPTQFDFTLLQQEAVFEEEERKVQEENKRLAEEARKKSREENKERLQNKVFRRETREDKLRSLIDPESTKPKRKPSPIRIESKRKKDPKRRKWKRKKKIKNYLRIGGVLDDDSENEIINGSSSDISDSRSENHHEQSGDEIVVDERPTRYGRIPRKRKTYEPTASHSCMRESRVKKKMKKTVVEEKYEPGSIMLVTTVGPNGEPVYNVLMVTADQNAQPIEVNPSIVETLKQAVTQDDICSNDIGMPDELRSLKTQNILKITARPYVEESNEENVAIPSEESNEENVTIPSEEICDATAPETPDRNYTIEENVTTPVVPTKDVNIKSLI